MLEAFVDIDGCSVIKAANSISESRYNLTIINHIGEHTI